MSAQKLAKLKRELKSKRELMSKSIGNFAKMFVESDIKKLEEEIERLELEKKEGAQ